MVLLARGDRDSAVRELDRILLIDPAYVPARLDLAVHALDAADYDRALGHLDAALQADDGNQRARFYRAVVLHHVGRSHEASVLLQSLEAGGTGPYAARARDVLATLSSKQEGAESRDTAVP